MNEKPTHLDLFSGIGGFSLAFEAEGFETIGFAEIDPYASAVLRKHWPHVPNYGDVRNVPTVGCCVVTGGFPCQPFSKSGLRGGAVDDRFLWPAMLDVIARNEPVAILGENVPGITTMELDRVCADLEDINYSTQPFSIPACAVGTTILRERIYVVAIANSFDGKARMGNFCERSSSIPKGASTECFHLRIQTARESFGRRDGIREEFYANRVHAIGNSIVPQVAQVFAKAIRQLI